MKFLCIECDHIMRFAERRLPGDGTMAAVYRCESCGHEMAMLTNPMETQLVSGLGVKVGGRQVPDQPMETVRTSLGDGRDDAFADAAPADTASPHARLSGRVDEKGPARVVWTDDALDRLDRVPSFVRGMVKRIYTDYAREQQIPEITTDIMDRARTDLGLEGM